MKAVEATFNEAAPPLRHRRPAHPGRAETSESVPPSAQASTVTANANANANAWAGVCRRSHRSSVSRSSSVSNSSGAVRLGRLPPIVADATTEREAHPHYSVPPVFS